MGLSSSATCSPFLRTSGRLAALCCTLAFMGPSLQAQTPAAPTAPIPGINSSVVAPDPAPNHLNILVFSDYACPFSSNLFFTLEKLQARYGSKLQIVYKQSPLPIHPEAPLAHRAALAAQRQGKFLQMSELLYANQAHLEVPALLTYARQIHLDMQRFRRDLDSPDIAARVETDLEESHAIGIDQTPTLYANGHPLIGQQSEQALSALFDQQLATSAVPPASPVPAGSQLTPALAAQIQNTPLAERGSADAPLTIVEFTDFECPFCRQAVEPMEKLLAARGRDVRWVFRAFPLDFHPDSQLATEAALAAGDQGKFWPMHDLIFANQKNLKLDDLRRYADSLHLDMKLFDEALATHRFAGEIAADRALGNKAGVDATPTFFIDGVPMAGVRTLPELLQIADAHPRAPLDPSAPRVTAVATPVPALSNQQVLGPSTVVPVTLTWYADVRSPLAPRQAELIRALAARYPGRVRVLFRAFALDQHPDSRLGAAALLAAIKLNPSTAPDSDQPTFWKLYDALAARRDILDRSAILAIASSLGFDPIAFPDALDNAVSDVQLNIADAGRRGIMGAPVVFINDQRIDGLQTESSYTDLIDKQLQNGPSAVRASLGH